jgi:hypothetical protein
VSKKCAKCGGNLQHDLCTLCEMFAEQSPPGGTCTGWPMKSQNMSVLPEQSLEANQHLAANGISSREAYYEKDGTLVMESAAARKKVLKSKKTTLRGGKEVSMTDLNSFN